MNVHKCVGCALGSWMWFGRPVVDTSPLKIHQLLDLVPQDLHSTCARIGLTHGVVLAAFNVSNSNAFIETCRRGNVFLMHGCAETQLHGTETQCVQN